jgi:hypothetical protein
MSRFFGSLRARVSGVFVAALALCVSVPAHAALPAEATAAFTEIGTSATDMLAAGWVPIGLVAAGIIGYKLFKRVTNKV